jgi:probable F420-dependent oxidoreductase
MTPFFHPADTTWGRPPVFLAAVGELMSEVAGDVADGVICHGFTTESYLREVTLPAIEKGLARSGRHRSALQVGLPAFVVTGSDEAGMHAAATAVRRQLAFYASTPNYEGVLAHHGWAEIQPELNRLSHEGRWDEMGALIDDDMLAALACVGEPDDIAAIAEKRFGGLLDRISFTMPYDVSPTLLDDVTAPLRG